MQASRNRKHQIGFTLLELLLAISISVVVSAGSYRILSASSEAILYLTSAQSMLKPIQELQWVLRHNLHSTILSKDYVKSENLTDAKHNADSKSQLIVFEPRRTSYLQSRVRNSQYLSTYTNTPTTKIWQDQITVLADESFEDSMEIVAQTLDSNLRQRPAVYSLQLKLTDESIGKFTLRVSR